jgi:hypothetical protein
MSVGQAITEGEATQGARGNSTEAEKHIQPRRIRFCMVPS